MINSSAFGNMEAQQAIWKITKILDGFTGKEKTEAILFDSFNIEKAYDKVNREKTLEQLENMGIQGRMMEFIREVIGEIWIKERVSEYISQSKQTDLGVPQGGVLSVTLLLVAINGILGEQRNGVDESLFADDTLQQEVREWHLENCNEWPKI